MPLASAERRLVSVQAAARDLVAAGIVEAFVRHITEEVFRGVPRTSKPNEFQDSQSSRALLNGWGEMIRSSAKGVRGAYIPLGIFEPIVLFERAGPCF